MALRKYTELPVAGGIFTIRLLPTLVTALMLVVLVGLGTWQVERLRWKENLIATINARIYSAPVNVTAVKDTGDIEYRPAKASGVFQHDHEFHLNAISLKGDGGYDILTPLRLDDGRMLLVNRGWAPYGGQKAGIGDQTPDVSRPVGHVEVEGILRIPHRHWMQPDNRPDQNDWYGIDLAAMAKSAGISAFLPYVLEAAAVPGARGYPVGGQTRIDLPNNHLNYAITWYSLAAVLLVIYGVSGWRRRP